MTIQHLLQITISEVLSTLLHAVSIIVWESLIERGGKRRSAIGGIRVSKRSWGQFKWFSLNHHGYGNIVVIRWVLDLVSILLSDGLESVVSDDLSEGLKSDAVNDIESVGWGNLEGEGSLLIDWNRNELGVTIINLGIGLTTESGGGVLQVLVGSRSSLNLGHSLSNKVSGGRGGGGLSDHSSSQGKLNNISHY